jgi:predicted NAD/FAD-binding protein
MKIAIIGSGISGLVAAYRLQPSHAVTVFEAGSYVGGHTNTVDVELDGSRFSIDSGFIVFNDWTYPNFIKLLDELKVRSQPTTMSLSVSDTKTGLEYNGHSLKTLFAQRRNLVRPSFYRMLADIVRFNREATKQIDDHDETMTVGEFLAKYRYSKSFAEHYLLPMGAAIWSCPMGKFREFPIRFIVEFYKNHGLLNIANRPTWRVVCGGSRTYVKAMTKSFQDRIRLRSPVVNVERFLDHVVIHTPTGSERFDRVVFACHSDQALKILGAQATVDEREILSAFPYERNVAVLHTDESLLPKRKAAWASWNYRVNGQANSPASVTYNMNILQGLRSPQTFCVTLNDQSMAPDKVLRRIEYDHPVFTTARAEAQKRHFELLTSNRTSFCGAYWRNGFHEDGVVSAIRVVEALSKLDESSMSAQLAGTVG